MLRSLSSIHCFDELQAACWLHREASYSELPCSVRSLNKVYPYLHKIFISFWLNLYFFKLYSSIVLSIQRKQQHAPKIYHITSLENGKVKKIIEYFLTHMGCVTKESFSRTHEKVADKIFGSFCARMHIATYLHVHNNTVLFKKWT